MADKVFKVKDGDEIIVRVGRRTTAAEGKTERRRRGMIRTRLEDDYLPRRLSKKGVTFYDLGQIPQPDGTFLDMVYYVDKSFYDAGGQLNLGSLLHADIAALENFFINLADLGSHSRRIEQRHNNFFKLSLAFDFGGVIDFETDPRFENGQLKLTAQESDAFGRLNTEHANRVFIIWFNDPLARNKFTNAPDYSAPGISPFKLQNGDKVYFVPLVNHSVGEVDIVEGGATTRHHLNYFYKVVPRQPYLRPAGTFYNENVLDYTSFILSTPFVPNLPRLFKARDYAESFPEARMWKWTFNTPLPPTPAPVNFLPSHIFPDTSTEPSVSGAILYSNNSSQARDNYQGRLKAIIVRGGSRFYCWNMNFTG